MTSQCRKVIFVTQTMKTKTKLISWNLTDLFHPSKFNISQFKIFRPYKEPTYLYSYECGFLYTTRMFQFFFKNFLDKNLSDFFGRKVLDWITTLFPMQWIEIVPSKLFFFPFTFKCFSKYCFWKLTNWAAVNKVEKNNLLNRLHQLNPPLSGSRFRIDNHQY